MTIHGPAEFDAAIGFSLGPKIEEARFVIAITDYCGAQLRRWVEPEHWHKIRVVRCAVEDELFDLARPIEPDCRTLVCVGRLTAQKGQLLLLDAVRRLVEEGVDLKLVFAGDGEMRPQVEQRIAEYQIESHVEITGWIDGDEVMRRLLDSRAMVLPSFAEGLPVVIMEAMALSRPVLSTYIAGIPELVEPGTQWLARAGGQRRCPVCGDPGTDGDARRASRRDGTRRARSRYANGTISPPRSPASRSTSRSSSSRERGSGLDRGPDDRVAIRRQPRRYRLLRRHRLVVPQSRPQRVPGDDAARIADARSVDQQHRDARARRRARPSCRSRATSGS